MKTSEYPEEDSRTVPFSASEEPPRPPAVEKPRYVEVPVSPEQARAQRNLAWGVVCLVVTLIGVWLGFKYDRGGTLKCLAASLGTFGILWLLYNFQIFRQRHGQFLGLGLAALLGALLPFIAAGLGRLDRLADERIAGEASSSSFGEVALTVPPPVPTAANAPAAPTAPEFLPESDAEAAVQRSLTRKMVPPPNANELMATSAKAAPDDGTIQDFNPPPLDMSDGKIIAIKQDCDVTIDGRNFRLKTGQRYKYTTFEDGVVTFLANGREIKIDFENVKFVGRSLEDDKAIHKMAWEEAFARYPALREETSPENRLLNRTWPRMEAEPDGAEFLKNPRWPVILADQLAAENHWATSEGLSEPAATGPETLVPPIPSVPTVPTVPTVPATNGKVPPPETDDSLLPPLDPTIPPPPPASAPVPKRAR